MFKCLFIIQILLIVSCSAKKTLVFDPATQNAKSISISIVEFGGQKGDGTLLGTLPLSVEIDKISGKSLKLSAPGFQDQYWVIPEQLGEKNTVNVKLGKSFEVTSKLSQLQAQSSLLLLKSYQALAEKKFQLAKNLAERSEDTLSLGPGSLIIRAIAAWKSGSAKDAENLLEEAKRIYPNFQEISELLKGVQLDG